MGASAEASSEDAARIALGAVAPPAPPARRQLGRAIAIGAPLVYVAALATVIVSWGLPLAHDQLFFWLLLGLAAFSVPGWRSWGIMLLAWLPWLGLLVVYDELRAAVSVAPADAFAGAQIALDPSEETVISRRFRTFTGPYVAHCHNLAHEDHNMMFGWEILPTTPA